MDFNPEKLFAPVASYETIKLLLDLNTREGLETEGCEVDNAYLFRDLDIRIRMKKPTN